MPGQHGTDAHPGIFAAVAREVYVPNLAPDFAYVSPVPFFELDHFQESYDAAASLTQGFEAVDVDTLKAALVTAPETLLTFRTICGLTKGEFAASTRLTAAVLEMKAISANKVDSMEKAGTAVTDAQALVLAETIAQILEGTLFAPEEGLRLKQQKPDTAQGWESVEAFAARGVPYATYLHQRHYGGTFRQLLDSGSEQRGDRIEEAVEALFVEHDIPHLRTGAHNQAEIARRFEVTVTPAPDFVVFDGSDNLRGLLECKGANDGGTARDKALRFERLRAEAVRLGGIPLFAILGGLGWTRVNDTLGPVVRDCDGRVFTLANLPEMLTVTPFPQLLVSLGPPTE